MGGGRANIGLGYCTSYRNWHRINATALLGQFLAGLPPEWRLPSLDALKKSKSLQAWRLPMGFTAAGECAVAALLNSGPDDFTNYAQRVDADGGRQYQLGRLFHRVVGVPAIANAGIKILDQVNDPGVRSRLLFWEGWRDPTARD